jgi:hypothetical protein
VKTNTRHQPSRIGHHLRRVVVTATAGVAISGAAFATVAVLVDQFQLEMSYGGSADTTVQTVGR